MATPAWFGPPPPRPTADHLPAALVGNTGSGCGLPRTRLRELGCRGGPMIQRKASIHNEGHLGQTGYDRSTASETGRGRPGHNRRGDRDQRERGSRPAPRLHRLQAGEGRLPPTSLLLRPLPKNHSAEVEVRGRRVHGEANWQPPPEWQLARWGRWPPQLAWPTAQGAEREGERWSSVIPTYSFHPFEPFFSEYKARTCTWSFQTAHSDLKIQ